MLSRLDLYNNPHVGVFLSVGEGFHFYPPGLTKKDIKEMERVLKCPGTELTLGGGRVLGSNMVNNQHGLLVSDIATEAERKVLEQTTKEAGLSLTFWEGRHNAVGNNLLVNDRVALVNPRIAPSNLRQIEMALDVEVHREALAGVEPVGLAGVATTGGLLVHAKAKPDELPALEELFGVKPHRATVNFGLPLVGAGVAGNGHGAVCGE